MEFKSDEFKKLHTLMLDMKQKFCEKLDDQLFIIRQQQDHLEYHQEQLNNQRVIIEELSWQIRDLRDCVRKCDEHMPSCQLEHSNGRFENRLKVSPIEEPLAESNSIYESINFVASTAAPDELQPNNTDTLQSENNFDTSQKKEHTRDFNTFFQNCNAPPPTKLPPKSPPNERDSESDQEPMHISSTTLEKLNSLYGAYKIQQSDPADLDEVVYRLREFKDFSTRDRGSSNAMCSFASNVEDDYLPRLDEEDCELSDETISKSSNELKSERSHRKRSTSNYKPSDVVFI